MRTQKALLAFFLWLIALVMWAPAARAQDLSSVAPNHSAASASNAAVTPPSDAPQAATGSGDPSDNSDQAQSGTGAAEDRGPAPPEPKRILWVIPNFRAVSAGTMPPPPKAREALLDATRNSFDYSAFIYVGLNSALSEWDNEHAQLGKGMEGFGRYYWGGFVNRTDDAYLVLFAMPTIFHQDERYYAMGRGKAWRRAVYAATRVLVTPNYHGDDAFNTSVFVGRAIAQGISLAYYPSEERNAGTIAERYALGLGKVAVTNVLREFWPDISARLRRKP